MVLFETDLSALGSGTGAQSLKKPGPVWISSHSGMEAKLLLATNPRANVPLSSAPFLEVFMVQTLEVMGDQLHWQGKFPEWLSSPSKNHHLLCPSLD